VRSAQCAVRSACACVVRVRVRRVSRVRVLCSVLVACCTPSVCMGYTPGVDPGGALGPGA
jgi:hypothetical protein